ncbi:tRNA-splicing endonuclease subunit sen54 [Friedmanniomyces endolithicus]|nr:tRNA-splicing endonuclease subunit sen54 [Friedmanniomyces endolithicus]KAK0796740.1 tRNA-splicing endonuclease subunit sen54 [Friedmanniomyces endolithicus]KAK0811494.1 tRNA-splicing endonuclease subunit sen54 [Friedmanniomyces endolithicus]KAK0812766.1 tRNA-splicing endonuclease subunit sen54 [Friedmanniomyces endolithicus]KAK0840770.1 tRNA-splicing endonuclease subunit sen54 [Friedmanniomyces endolithicus]
MADADEDVIPRSGPLQEDVDLSEEIQDFRFLGTATGNDVKIPKRGEKDFEPHETALQSNTLAASRQAMHNALSFQRVHPPKGVALATFHPESNMAYALNPKGSPLFVRMGRTLSKAEDPIGDDGLRGQRMWFLPEEVIYLVERGTIDLRWPVQEDDEDDKGLPMSLQAAYAMFLGEQQGLGGALTFERYSVYSGLKRAGYTILRAASFEGSGPPATANCYPPLPQRTWQAGLLSLAWLKYIFHNSEKEGHERLEYGLGIAPGLYRSYADIYRRLALIPWYDPTNTQITAASQSSPTDGEIRVTYHVWKPGSATFKKSDHGPPDFRIAVVDARETTAPSLQQLGNLMATLPYEPPKAEDQLYQKLKHGYKNVILAIVDQGVVSYLRISDAAFGRERLYERAGRGFGGKRGGRGGRGRGRGR